MSDRTPEQSASLPAAYNVMDLRTRQVQKLQQEAALKGRIETLCLAIFSQAAASWALSSFPLEDSASLEEIVERSMKAAFQMASTLWGVEIQRTPKIIPIVPIEDNANASGGVQPSS